MLPGKQKSPVKKARRFHPLEKDVLDLSIQNASHGRRERGDLAVLCLQHPARTTQELVRSSFLALLVFPIGDYGMQP